ncbi:hypothetical protein CEXT_644981 [Caerostris extrusa]|uniref:Uncharacterized protein n=1 Tax=Caerostris extrusa TaxID=172846 RepID=A0AAV4RF99_CAEEX|nr:hypothetical protein CEXT_644981 [Caerostris extrusa]
MFFWKKKGRKEEIRNRVNHPQQLGEICSSVGLCDQSSQSMQGENIMKIWTSLFSIDGKNSRKEVGEGSLVHPSFQLVPLRTSAINNILGIPNSMNST